jgi:4'-phosphopantetheinyl transferase EntD
MVSAVEDVGSGPRPPRRPDHVAGLVPDSVTVVERFADVSGVPLFAAEEAAIARAVPKRRNEFTTVRYCARLALAALGVEPVPLVPGPRGAPVWPSGVVGSMTHCDGYRAAAVAQATDIVALGIDAEPHEPLPDGVLDLVSRPTERRHITELAGAFPDVCWDRVLFSAKESVYKAWFPVAEQWLGFEEAELSFDPMGGTFEVTILKAPPIDVDLTNLHGRWSVAGVLVATTVVRLRENAGTAADT